VHLAGALEVARQIDYVGGDPDREVKDAEYSQDSRRMLVIGLKQEQSIIKRYRENQSSGTLWRICTFGSIRGLSHRNKITK
jgi:hypothetical protein